MKKLTALTLCLVMLVMLFAGCGKDDSKKDSTDAEGAAEISILVVKDAEYDINMELIDGFNERYEGTYKVVPEEITGDADDVRSKIRMLNSSNSLPTIITGADGDAALYDLLVQNDRLVDIAPYVEADSEWAGRLIDGAVEGLTNEDGKLYMSPNYYMNVAGMYWNKELFAQAGIDTFPETWEELFDACEKLQDKDITPFSLQTAGGAWTTMLAASAYLGTTEAGQTFIDEKYPDTYNNDEFKKMLELCQQMFAYTTEDALGGDYALAANHFFAEDTAMIANGPWMMAQLTDDSYAEAGLEERIGYAAFPGNVVMSTFTGWSIGADSTKEQQDGAVEYMKYLSEPENVLKLFKVTGAFSTKVTLETADYEELIPPMKDYVDLYDNIGVIVPNYQTKWDSISQNEVFNRDLPNLVQDKMSVDEFIDAMNAAALQFKQETE